MRQIGILLYDDVQALDVSGPMDVFAAANAISRGGEPAYALTTIGLGPGAVRCENGLVLVPDSVLETAPAFDTLVIPGGAGSRVFDRDPHLLDWLRARIAVTRRVASICTGLYVLAATGAMDGRRVTTHWRYAEDLRRRHPRLRMDADQLFVHDGPFHTSGGLTAGLDLALSLVEDDLGSDAALAVARELVMYMKRPGNQAQFSVPLAAQTRGGGRLSGLADWLLDHLDEDLDVERLAGVMSMSARHFRRLFGETFETSPSAYIERLRLERACLLLTTGAQSIERIAQSVGFASADSFRRRFRQRYHASPQEYRARFVR